MINIAHVGRYNWIVPEVYRYIAGVSITKVDTLDGHSLISTKRVEIAGVPHHEC
jgi:hypothetical protein